METTTMSKPQLPAKFPHIDLYLEKCDGQKLESKKRVSEMKSLRCKGYTW